MEEFLIENLCKPQALLQAAFARKENIRSDLKIMQTLYIIVAFKQGELYDENEKLKRCETKAKSN